MNILKSYLIILVLLSSSIIYFGCSGSDAENESAANSDSTNVEQKSENDSEKEKDLELIPVEVAMFRLQGFALAQNRG